MISTAVGTMVQSGVTLVLHIAAISLLAVAVAGWRVAKPWFKAHTSEKTRNVITSFAKEAYAFAEFAYNGMGGSIKLQGASDYLAKRLDEHGIQVSGAEITAAVQNAWHAAEGVFKTQQRITNTPTVPAPVQPPIDFEQIKQAAVDAATKAVGDAISNIAQATQADTGPTAPATIGNPSGAGGTVTENDGGGGMVDPHA